MDVKQSQAFEAYRANPPKPVTLGRLLAGALIIAVCWIGVSIFLIIGGSIVSGGNLEDFTTTPVGTLGLFATFAGIWLGVWIAMRLVHNEPVRYLFGASSRLSTGDFWRGFGAVVLTSVLSEALIYLVWPEMARGDISIGQWLVYLIPVALLCFVQTSSEEVLFRGYLLRGLANRFRSPWIWALLPGLAFLSMHYTPDMGLYDILLLVFTIGALTAALTLIVYVTGNLGAAFGIHMGNNLFAFVMVSHQTELGEFALLRGASVDRELTTHDLLSLVAISLVCIGLTVVLLLHRASPLRVKSDVDL